MDSLKSPQFILRLEAQIGHRVSLELLTPDTTPRAFAQLLAAPAASAAPETAHLFLMPGLLGDELTLAAFRRGTADVARYDLIELSDLETPAATLRDVPLP